MATLGPRAADHVVVERGSQDWDVVLLDWGSGGRGGDQAAAGDYAGGGEGQEGDLGCNVMVQYACWNVRIRPVGWAVTGDWFSPTRSVGPAGLAGVEPVRSRQREPAALSIPGVG